MTMTLTVCVEQRALVTLNGCAKTRQCSRRMGTGCVATDSQKRALVTSNDNDCSKNAATVATSGDWQNAD